VFDPNAGLSGNNIKSAADVSYSTLGAGLVYHWDENVKLMAYYDKVQNETTTAKAPFDKDLNDDVFTFRIQYKF
jgi:opacity protein-like surface antigen